MLGVVAAIAIALPAVTKASDAPLPLKLVKDVVLSDAPSRFNYQDFDAIDHRLYITNPGAARVIVFDTDADRVVGEVHDLPGVRGVLAVPKLGRVYATPRTISKITVIDPQTLKVAATVPGGDGLASLAYATDAKKLFVSLAKGNGDEVVDASSDRVLAPLVLNSKAGYTVYDPTTKHILVTAESKNALTVIDPQTSRVIASYPLAGCLGAHAIALDSQSETAYVACEDNMRLVSFNLASEKETGIDSVGDNVDVIANDPVIHRLYVSSESGTVSVFDTSSGTAHKLAQAFFAQAAHTVAVDPSTHFVYFPLENVGGHQVLRIMRPVL